MTSEKAIMRAFQKGQEAYRLGRSEHTNPHGGPEFAAWHCGWLEARDAAEGGEEELCGGCGAERREEYGQYC